MKSRIVLILGIVLCSLPAAAGVIVVNTTTDDLDMVFNGLCTVREAIEAARTDSPPGMDCPGGIGDDTILIPAGNYRLDDTLTITTDGQNVILAGASIPRPVFSPANGANYVSNFDIIAGTGAGKVTLQTLEIKLAFVGVRLVDETQLRIDDTLIRFAEEVGVEVQASVNADPPSQPYLQIEDSVIEEIAEGATGTGILLAPGPGEDQEVLILRTEIFNCAYEAVEVTGSYDVTITDSTIYDNGGGGSVGAGGIGQAGGSLTVTGSEIRHNSGAVGGIRYSDSFNTLTLTDVVLLDNVGGASGGVSIEAAIANLTRVELLNNRLGGGLDVLDGIVTITDSLISGNEDDEGPIGGGGINVSGGELHLWRVVVVDNSATFSSDFGGGIYFSGGETLTLNDSTVGRNQARFDGGGLYLAAGTAIVTNSTIGANTSSRGAGIFVDFGSLFLTGATVAQNIAGNTAGGIFIEPAGFVTAGYTIVGDNFETSSANNPPDCEGSIDSNGYNLVTELFGCTITGDTTGNITGVPAGLKAFGNVGGSPPSYGHLPLGNSPVIDAGLTAGGCLAEDQRGVVRPVDGDEDGDSRCDIGAIEYAFELFFDGFDSGDTTGWDLTEPE